MLWFRLFDVKNSSSNIGTTADIYVHASMEQNKNAVEKLNELEFNS